MPVEIEEMTTMATVDPTLEQQINHETDLRFWEATAYKVGGKLDPKDPADAKMIPKWIAINKIVRQQAANGQPFTTQPTDQIATQKPPPAEIQMPDDYVGKSPAPVSAHSHVSSTGGHSHASHPAAPPARPAIDPETQKQLYAETNARFWAQTGYRPGQKLDASKPADAAMMPVWMDVYKKVEAQYRAGSLQLTHDHPVVTQGITDAAHHTANAAASVHAATQAAAAGDRDTASQYLADAHGHHQQAAAASATAAQVQPPTVSPELAQRAAHQIQSFVMNAAGQGVPVGPPQDAYDVVAAMQGASAPAQAAAGASVAPPSQTAPADQNGAADSIPTFPATPGDKAAKHDAGRGRAGMAIGIALAGVATVGLGVFALTGKRHGYQIRYKTAHARR